MPDETQPTTELHHLRTFLGPVIKALRGRIQDGIDELGVFHAAEIRQVVMSSHEAKAFLAALQDALDAGHAPADVAMVFLQFQHGFCFGDSTVAGALVISNDAGHHSLASWLEDYGDELEVADEVGGMQMSNRQIEKCADRFLEEIVTSVPEDEVSIVRSRPFVEGWIHAMIAGASNPSGAAWAAWRRHKCPQGAEAYNRAQEAGASKREAMAAFYREASRRGLHVRPPDKVKSIRSSGLVLQSGRCVDWRIALMKLRANELDLPREERVRLKDILSARGWGAPLVAAL